MAQRALFTSRLFFHVNLCTCRGLLRSYFAGNLKGMIGNNSSFISEIDVHKHNCDISSKIAKKSQRYMRQSRMVPIAKSTKTLLHNIGLSGDICRVDVFKLPYCWLVIRSFDAPSVANKEKLNGALIKKWGRKCYWASSIKQGTPRCDVGVLFCDIPSVINFENHILLSSRLEVSGLHN